MPETAILQVKNLTTQIQGRSRPITIVDKLSFSLKKGQTLAVVGESGSGKTITALSLLQLLPQPPMLPPQGEALFEGQNLLKLSQRKIRKIRGRRISMIFQDPMSALNPVYTIGDQLLEVCYLHLDLNTEDAFAHCVNTLKEVGIASPQERMNEYPHQLSGGMQQRIMIAMALLCEPDILIADEPTTALDVTIQAQILELMKRLQKKKETAIMLITHDMSIVAEMAHEVIVMYAGESIEYGGVNALFDHSAHPYTQGLFASLPKQHYSQHKLSHIRGTIPSLDAVPAGCRFHPRCPHVMPKCRHGFVPYFARQHSAHQSRCWLHEEENQSS